MRRRDSSAFFTSRGFALSLAGGTSEAPRGWGLHAALLGAREVQPVAEKLQQSTVNHYVGKPSNWQTEMPTYGQVAWEEIYPGIDMVIEPARGGFAYRFVLSPGAKVSDLVMRWSGANSARAVDDGRGVDLDTDIGVLRVRDLRAFAIGRTQRRTLIARQIVHGSDVAFEVDGWDGQVPLIIDPTITWSSFVGSDFGERAEGIAVDGGGNALITGFTESATFPAIGGFDTTRGGLLDAFVMKVSATGSLLWSSYLGGSSGEYGTEIAVDGSGNAFVTGDTESSDFATIGALDSTLDGTRDPFVAKVSASGSLAWATYLGGSSDEFAGGIAVDVAGNAFATGRTRSTDFPLLAAFDTAAAGEEAYLTKLSSSGSLLWSTYVGGSSSDRGEAVAVDSAGNAVITGSTTSTDFPTPGGFATTMSGSADAFVTKVSASGALIWSTYLGGGTTAWETGTGIAADVAGNILVVGSTASATFPTTGGFDTTRGGDADAFVAKISATGALVWSSYLGGSSGDAAYGVDVDGSGNVFVTGYAGSSDFPTTGGFATTYAGNGDAFVTKVSGGGALVWSSYLGGTYEDLGFDIAVDATGDALVAGYTHSSNFPVLAGFDLSGGGLEGFVTKLHFGAAGAPCVLVSECRSAHCVDGVCCDRACGTCEACTAAKKGSGTDGTCGPISDGTDPDRECAAQTCTTGVITKAHVCNGAGACRSDGTTTCGLYAYCFGSECATSCGNDSHCVAAAFCSAGTCSGDLELGKFCDRAGQCASGFCVDGVCCDRACTGDCEACVALWKGSGTDGTCGNIAADTDPKNKCTADSTPLSCNADGMCDGAGACRTFAKPGKACGATTCTSGAVSGRTCNGSGTCETATTPCAPYGCDASACKASCASDSDCAADAYCTTAGSCVTKKKSGDVCTAGRECDKGHCVDSICCESACSGQCEACGEPGTMGQCVPVAGAPRNGRAACAGNPAVCGGTCDGKNASACAYAPSTKGCGSACSAGKETPSACDGAGTCAVMPARDCAPFACADDKICATSCTADAQCASGATCVSGNCVQSEQPASPAAEDGGCSCESSPRGSGYVNATWLAALLAALAHRRTRRRSASTV